MYNCAGGSKKSGLKLPTAAFAVIRKLSAIEGKAERMHTESEKLHRGMSLGIPKVDDARKRLTLDPSHPGPKTLLISL